MCILTVSSWLYNVLAIGKVTSLDIKGSGLLHGLHFLLAWIGEGRGENE